MSTTANNPCRTCARCCRWYMVGVSGYDVWRISSRQRLDPEQFLIVHRKSDRGLDTFQLERGGGPLAIGLDKRGQAETEHTQPCVFLMTLRDGHERCGIYADRPDACRTYPSGVVRNIMAQRDGVQCPPGSWPADTWEQPRWLLSQQRQDMNADVYAEVVARWNARVAGEPVGTQFTLHGYLA